MFNLNQSGSIIDRPPAAAEQPIETVTGKNSSVFRDLKTIFKDLNVSASKGRIFLLVALASGVLILNVLGEIRMNRWRGAFFRAIEQKQLGEVLHQSILFVVIMLVLLSLVVSQNWLLDRFKIRFREWLTHHLMSKWLQPSQAYRLNMTAGEQLNPDQRIQEDVRHFSEMTGDLGMGILRSTLMLISFIGVLWVMSDGITLPFFGNVQIPGYMVWFALAYAVAGSLVAGKVGRPLIGLNEQRYTKEANFRYSLVRVNDNAESIAFYGGEKDERKIINRNFETVLKTMRSLSFANARLTWVVVGHGWMVVIIPVLVALPGYVQGKLDFGGLMMVVGAFEQVQQSLRWIVENFARIADWRATLQRVTAFRDIVHDDHEVTEQPEMITLTRHLEGHLAFEKTSVSLMDGKVVISDATAHIYPGDRVLLTGESGTGKSTLLRAVAGLWPWGSGSISLPANDQMMFLPQRPYIPLGTLAAAVAYPRASNRSERSEIEAVLRKVNLSEFIPMLGEVARWDKLMSLGQQQRLAFARLLLHKPKWIFLDEATSALDDTNQSVMMSLFLNELSTSAVISVAHRPGLEQFHNRNLQLILTETGVVLTKKARTQTPPVEKSLISRIRNPLAKNRIETVL